MAQRTGVMRGLDGCEASGVVVGEEQGEEPVVRRRKSEPMLARPRPGEEAHEGAPSHATALVTSSRSPRLLVALEVERVGGGGGGWRWSGWVEEVEGGGGAGGWRRVELP